MTRHLLMTADTIGGVWQYALGLAEDLVANGWAVDIALLGPAATPAQRTAAATAGATLIDTDLPLDWLAPSAQAVADTGERIAALATERGATVVQLNQPALAIAEFALPVVAVAHSCVATWWDAVETGPLPADLAWQTDLVARGLERADAVVCPTRAFAATVARRYSLTDTPIAIHNGRRQPAALGDTLGDGVVTAGRLWDRGKNVATLDRAAARLSLPFRAAGATRGPHGEQVTLHHLDALGHIGDAEIAELLSQRPIFASAARYEPFGLAALEAALAGCALVLADIPTFRELWSDVATFVAADDADGFADAIAALAADPARRLARGTAARRRAQDYSPDAMASAMRAIYDRLATGRRAVAA